ncbi:MAG: hypothetical protein GY750_06735, partial [Lentisphaerae bacterium]|nr:hypothetical protein [Lentisphaerota bacterium]
QGYKAVTHDMVTAVLRDSLINHGIIIAPNLIAAEVVEAGSTQSGTPIIRFESIFEISFINMDEPADKLVISVGAHANDMSDKAPGKATSYAVKYAMLKLFSLETGENEESRMEGERKGKAAAEHLKDELMEYVECGDSLAVMLFSKAIGQEMYTDIFNSAPHGKKGPFKKQLGEMEKQGHGILVNINQAILEEDDLRAKENLSDITPGGKKLLATHLGPEKSKILGKLTEA